MIGEVLNKATVATIFGCFAVCTKVSGFMYAFLTGAGGLKAFFFFKGGYGKKAFPNVGGLHNDIFLKLTGGWGI